MGNGGSSQTAMLENFRVECAWEFGRGSCLSEGFLVGRELTLCFSDFVFRIA